MPDRTLTCAGCEGTFVFTEKEQEFHLSRGLT
ncbi:MAG: zinc-ribbon domain containing protein, partial [Planctomycetota bacterium]